MKYFRPIAISFLFLAMQGIASILVCLSTILINEDIAKIATNPNLLFEADQELFTGNVIAYVTILSGCITVYIAYLLGMIDFKSTFNVKRIRWSKALMAFLGAILFIAITDMLNQVIRIPDLLSEQFNIISNSAIGIIAIALVGPIVEELVFRESIIRSMLSNGANKYEAILFSSLCFGLVHFNPAQVFFAFFVGLVLAMIYVKTGSVVVTSIIHVFNNSTYIIFMYVFGKNVDDYNLPVWTSLGIALLLAYPSYKLLFSFWSSKDV